jgi:RimJ/RimL family protein N-acetyltransferase
MDEPVSPLDLLRAVLDPVRLAVLGSAAQGSLSIDGVAQRLGVHRKDVAKAIGDLRSLGILDKDGSLDREILADIGRSLPSGHSYDGEPIDGPWTGNEAITLGRFFSGDRLVEIPSSASKRRLVLEKIAQEFEPGERYAERDLNFKIQLIHADYAAIRRYMIDEGLMDRADGAYWRTGGRYETPADDKRELLSMSTSIDGVVLREYDATRIDQLFDAAAVDRIHRFMSDRFPHPYEIEDAQEWIEFCSKEDSPNNFAIEVAGVVRGGVGAAPLSGENEGVAEIGWWLTPELWGRGITSAAAMTLVDHMFRDRGFERLWAPVFAPNEASAAVAMNAGMLHEGTAPSAYVKYGVRYDQRNFGITRAQWEALRAS